MKQKGYLYLIPTPLNLKSGVAMSQMDLLLPKDLEIVKKISHFVVENLKSARAFLKQIHTETPLQQLNLCELNEHTKNQQNKNYADYLKNLLRPSLENGENIGVISEAGCPAIADPGGELVFLAHQQNILVKPLIGASSILLAMMASGLNGQQFCFHGYLAKTEIAKKQQILDLQKQSQKYQQTQIFIETPYKNIALFQNLLQLLNDKTKLSVAINLTLQDEFILTLSVKQWKNLDYQHKIFSKLDKNPCVFSFLAL